MTKSKGVPFPESYMRIKVVGVGTDGCNYVDWMIEQGLQGVEFIAVHSDAQTLAHSLAPTRVRIGPTLTRGFGAGYDPEIGRKAAEESAEELYKELKGADMIFITAGMSGGTGTGAAPIIAQIAGEIGALTIGVVTTPYDVEGTKRLQAAELGTKRLDQYSDALFVFSKQKILVSSSKQASLKALATVTGSRLLRTIQGIIEMITIPGLVNLDFADVRSILKKGGTSFIGIGNASGVNRVCNATESAISDAGLFDSIRNAKRIMLNFTGGPNFSLYEVNQAAEIVQEKIDPHADMIFGVIIDPEIGEEVRVTLYIVGLDLPKKEFNTDSEQRKPDQPVRIVPKEKLGGIAIKRPLQVFLCHSSGDKPSVRALYQKLSNEDHIAPWLDEVNLLPGERWDLEIKKAVKNSDVVVVCLSRSSINKEGYIQKEIRIALDVADEKPEGTIFIIPLRLEDCDVPERLRNWQWVNYYEADAYERLMKSLRKRGDMISIQLG